VISLSVENNQTSTETVPVHWRELANPTLTKTVFQFDGVGAASANPYVFLGF
jgi:hypothetical protein